MLSLSAFKRAGVLLCALLLMAAVWGLIRIPGANMLIVVFTFLTSALLADIRSFHQRLTRALRLALYSSSAQFLTGISQGRPVLQFFLCTLFACFTFFTLPRRDGCIAMLIGYLAFFAPPGYQPAIDRIIGIFAGIPVIMTVTMNGLFQPDVREEKASADAPCLPHEALEITAQLGTGHLLFQLLQLFQGPWIMLTILFITMSASPGKSLALLAIQRIFAVPLGILAGGFLLGTFCTLDYHFVYLVPFIGAAGFFLLYNNGDFFLFSVGFMAALTIFSDWMTGPYTRFHFWELFLSRTLATLPGALLVLTSRDDGKKI
ncbi:MAG: hypothetical protein IKC65_09665 [Lentisphaeria bacterium]|nr:hypothetical protein [Lentisphaeria bacterium]